jgi:hypothetical protein
MFLAPPAGKAGLPSSLVVGGPLSRSYQDITCLQSDFSSPRHIRSLSQGAQCVEPPEQTSPAASLGMPHPPGANPLWRNQKRNSLPRDLHDGTNATEDSPTDQRHLRRVVSDKPAPPHPSSPSGSPAAPRKSVGSFIRRHLRSSTAPEQDPDSQGRPIPPSLRVSLAASTPSLTYNSPHGAQSISLAHSPSSTTVSPRTSAADDHRRLLPEALTTHSPVAADPFEDARQRGRRLARPDPPSSSVSTPAAPAPSWGTRDDMIALPRPAGGFPSPMAPAAPHTDPIPQTPFLDTKTAEAGAAAAAESEGLDSPSEFALFAAATSSFGFLPSTFDLAVSHANDGTAGPPAPSAAATAAPVKRPPALTLRTDFFAPAVAAPRSRSQPPPASPSDLWMPGMPPRYGGHHGHRLSHAAPQQRQRQQQQGHQHHQYSRSHHQVSTAHLAALAPSATNNRNPRHSQTFPGASSASSTTAATTAAPPARPTSVLGAATPPSPPLPPSPPKLDDVLAAFLAAAADDGPPPGDEELPDYATSQAQAQASRRDEAARRARELEEGWLRGRAERARGRPWRGWERGGGF